MGLLIENILFIQYIHYAVNKILYDIRPMPDVNIGSSRPDILIVRSLLL